MKKTREILSVCSHVTQCGLWTWRKKTDSRFENTMTRGIFGTKCGTGEEVGKTGNIAGFHNFIAFRITVKVEIEK